MELASSDVVGVAGLELRSARLVSCGIVLNRDFLYFSKRMDRLFSNIKENISELR